MTASSDHVPAAEALITRVIPSSGERLAVLGVGTNAYGVTEPEDLAARSEVLRRMPMLGAALVDTAAAYGASEAVIGALLKELGNRDQLFIATKVMEDTAEAGRASIEASFRKLQTDRIDLFQLHNFRGLDAILPILRELKAAGRIRYIGGSAARVEQHAMVVEALRNHAFDFVQINYSIGDRDAADTVLPIAQERGVAVLLNFPLGGRSASLFNRVAGRTLPSFAAEIDAGTWGQLFLKYSLSHPAVTAAIPGMTKVAHLEDNLGAARGRLASPELRREMETWWDDLPAFEPS